MFRFCVLYSNVTSLLLRRLINHLLVFFHLLSKKFIIPSQGKKDCLRTVNTAWRRHKSNLKKIYFTPYKTMSERLKYRPNNIPLDHFKELLNYWRCETIKVCIYLFQIISSYYYVSIIMLLYVGN